MTAREKARELYEKYEFVYIQNYTSKHEVKQCILIAIEELETQAMNIHSENPDVPCDHELRFWNKVREEINLL